MIKRNVLVYPRSFFVEDLIFIRNHGEMLLNLVKIETTAENQWLVQRHDEQKVQTTLQQRRNGVKTEISILRASLLTNRLHPDNTSLRADFLIDGHLYLSFDSNSQTNSVSGFLRSNGEIVNIDEIRLVGSGMQPIRTVNSAGWNLWECGYEGFLDSEYAKERWAMSRKALGPDVWRRLCLLRFMIVGAGRSGEAAFLELARLGVGKITICDDDAIERRNIGEMKLIKDSDIGRGKAPVIVERVSELRRTDNVADCFEFSAIESSNFEGIVARQSALESDVIICCVDSESGRDYASYLASRYYKVLVDIGTGVRKNQSQNEARTGFDVRLILPGDGCLRCCGGLDEAQSELEMFNRSVRGKQRTEGHSFRAGSLSSLNSAAVSEALMLLQDLCVGGIQRSTWIQFEKKKGRTVSSPIPRSKEQCDCKA